MVTIKAYTDLQQSKKLAEILPLESADMVIWGKNLDAIAATDAQKFMKGLKDRKMNYIPCWSLAALLELITKVQKDVLLFNLTYDFILNRWTMNIEADNWKNDIGLYDNPIDACVAMIEKLNELNLL